MSERIKIKYATLQPMPEFERMRDAIYKQSAAKRKAEMERLEGQAARMICDQLPRWLLRMLAKRAGPLVLDQR